MAQLQSLVAALKRVEELERELTTLRAAIARPDSDSAYIGRLLCDDITRATRSLGT
jgi:hypothetical protein